MHAIQQHCLSGIHALTVITMHAVASPKEHWRAIKITWEDRVRPVVHPSPSTELTITVDTPTNKGTAPLAHKTDALRLFRDGLKEVTIAEFCREFRELGREDILIAGTRGAITVAGKD